MKLPLNFFILVSTLLVLIYNVAFTDAAAAAVNHEEPKIESSGSDEYDESSRSLKDTGTAMTHKRFPELYRRYPLKFGVLGKRYSYGYLGKRADVPQTDYDSEEWLNYMRERRAGRPQYGILG